MIEKGILFLYSYPCRSEKKTSENVLDILVNYELIFPSYKVWFSDSNYAIFPSLSPSLQLNSFPSYIVPVSVVSSGFPGNILKCSHP